MTATEWASISKTFVLEGAFVGAVIAVLTGHDTSDIIGLVWALGGTLGVLRITDVIASTVISGQTTTLEIQKNGNGHASTPTS